MFRKLAILGILALVLMVAYGSAAALTVTGGSIQAGEDLTLWCDPDGVFVTGWGLETDDNTVRNVKVGGIDGACVGNEIFVKVTGAGGSTLFYSSAVPVASPNMTFAFPSPYLAPQAIEDLHVWIEGPNP
jgi:hypothetical protein